MTTNCKCCGFRAATTWICYKPNGVLYRVALCGGCFYRYKINADFLEICLREGPSGRYAKFRELVDDEPQAEADAA